MPVYPEHVLKYLARIYDPSNARFACKATTPQEVALWQAEARPALRQLIGLDNIAASVGGHQVAVELGPVERVESHLRRLGHIETEPDVRVPFWMLRPHGDGPFPLAITPHGHEAFGLDQYAGIPHSAEMLRAIMENDGDAAVQAVSEGFLTIAPATRGLGCDGVPDVGERHGRTCRSQLMHCLMAGRTAVGERVWDMARILDWAIALPEVNPKWVLMLGNSGGGVVTMYAAACDPRIAIAIPSSCYSTLVSRDGMIQLHDCNTIPGILQYGEACDILGLLAPRHLLTVVGALDAGKVREEVERAVIGLQRIYGSAGAQDRYQHRYGDAGHRFYRKLMWPFVRVALDELGRQTAQ